MSACTRKRKLEPEPDSTEMVNDDNQNNATNNFEPARKKPKLNDNVIDKTDSKEPDIADDDTFQVQLASDKIIKLFSSNTVNNKDNNDKTEQDNELISCKIGSTDWKFEFYQLPTDPNNDIYKFLDGLFGDKLCDWKEYIVESNHDDLKHLNYKPISSNNFVSIIKDNLGIWRGAILFIVYELSFKDKDNDDLKYLIKIPLAGVDLHYRRQNVGTILVNYTVSIIHQMMENKSDKYQIIVLVIDEKQPRSFWQKNKFIPAIEHKKIDYHHIFEKKLMEKKNFVRDIENELIIMIYIGDKTTDLVFKNEMIEQFEIPKYVNFNKRYCKRDEIEATEKAHAEWERKKKELEEKQKLKGDNEDDDDESDEDFDIQEAEERQSSEDDEYDDEYDDDLDDVADK